MRIALFGVFDPGAQAQPIGLLLLLAGLAGCVAEAPRFASNEAKLIMDTNPGVTVLVDSKVVKLTTAAEKEIDCMDNLRIAREVLNATTKTLRSKRYRVQPTGFAAVGLGTTGKFEYRQVRNLRLANTCIEAEPTENARELVARAVQHAPFEEAQRAALGAPLAFVVGVQGYRDEGSVVANVILTTLEATGMVLNALSGELWAPDDPPVRTSLSFNFALLDTRSGTVLWQLEECYQCQLSGQNSVTDPFPLFSTIRGALGALPGTVPVAQ